MGRRVGLKPTPGVVPIGTYWKARPEQEGRFIERNRTVCIVSARGGYGGFGIKTEIAEYVSAVHAVYQSDQTHLKYTLDWKIFQQQFEQISEEEMGERIALDALALV